MRSWLDCYGKYIIKVEKHNEIKDVKKHEKALLKAETDFNLLWIFIKNLSRSGSD